jgi:hypothetical protein
MPALNANDALRFLGHGRHLATIVMAARCADMVRTLELAAIGTFDIGHSGERIMRTTLIALRLGDLFLGNGHEKLL